MIKPMKAFVVTLSAFLAFAAGQEQSCSAHVERACLSLVSSLDQGGDESCSSIYGGFQGNVQNLNTMVKYSLQNSFKFLFMASHFDRDDVNRHGIHKRLMGFSDKLWEDGKKIAKYILKRGGNFKDPQHSKSTFTMNNIRPLNFEDEVQSMAVSLDIWKRHAEDAVKVVKQSMHRTRSSDSEAISFDPHTFHFMQEELLDGYTDLVRATAGDLNVLARIAMNDKTRNLGLTLFDKAMNA